MHKFSKIFLCNLTKSQKSSRCGHQRDGEKKEGAKPPLSPNSYGGDVVLGVRQMRSRPNLKAPFIITRTLAQEIADGGTCLLEGGVVANHMVAALIGAVAVDMAVVYAIDGHMPTLLSREGLRAKPLICTVVETPRLPRIAVCSIPRHVTADMAAKGVDGGGAENLARLGAISPMSASGCHRQYLTSMYSEGSVPRPLYHQYTTKAAVCQGFWETFFVNKL